MLDLRPKISVLCFVFFFIGHRLADTWSEISALKIRLADAERRKVIWIWTAWRSRWWKAAWQIVDRNRFWWHSNESLNGGQLGADAWKITVAEVRFCGFFRILSKSFKRRLQMKYFPDLWQSENDFCRHALKIRASIKIENCLLRDDAWKMLRTKPASRKFRIKKSSNDFNLQHGIQL